MTEKPSNYEVVGNVMIHVNAQREREQNFPENRNRTGTTYASYLKFAQCDLLHQMEREIHVGPNFRNFINHRNYHIGIIRKINIQ